MNECDINNLVKTAQWPCSMLPYFKASGTISCVRRVHQMSWACVIYKAAMFSWNSFYGKWHCWFNKKDIVGEVATICHFLSKKTQQTPLPRQTSWDWCFPSGGSLRKMAKMLCDQKAKRCEMHLLFFFLYLATEVGKRPRVCIYFKPFLKLVFQLHSKEHLRVSLLLKFLCEISNLWRGTFLVYSVSSSK